MTSTLIKSINAKGHSYASPPLNAPTVQKLSNGLTVVAESLPVDAVNLNVWLNIGSAIEPDPINGMAHFLEHMMFKGTPRLKMGEFEKFIEQRGAVTNAATSHDYTHYYITSAPQDFADLAPLQLDIVLNPSIPDDAFERERLVVLEEIKRSEDNPQRRTYQRAMQVAFNRLPYRRPVLGPSEVIANMKPQEMRDFHQSYYHPSNMTAVAVGNLPVDELIAVVSEAADSVWQKDKPFLTPAFPVSFPPLDSRPFEIIEEPFNQVVRQEFIDERLQQARLIMVWRVPGLQALNQTYALDIVATILGQGRTSRLVQDLRENQQLVTSVSASNSSYVRQGLFSIAVQLPVAHLAQVEQTIISHLEKLQTELITDEEIERVQKQVANRFVFGNETPSDRANLYGYYQSIVGDLKAAFDYPSRIQSVTQAELHHACRDYLTPHAYGVVVVKPN